jgi:hypothetical protein
MREISLDRSLLGGTKVMASSRRRTFGILLVLALLAIGFGCSGTAELNSPPGAQTYGQVYVLTTDAPLSCVLSFKVTVTGLTLTPKGGGAPVSVLSSPTDIEFARLEGIQNLLDLTSVPADIYDAATTTLANPVIAYLDTTTNPATVQTINGTLTTSTVPVPLNPPLEVSETGIVGLRVDFRVADSLVVDANGQLTGSVNPVLTIRAVRPRDLEGHVDEVRGGIVSIDVAAGTFVIQTRRGRTITIKTDANTVFDDEGSLDITRLVIGMIVEVEGTFNSDGTIQAEFVKVIAEDRFVVGGLITELTPPTGTADQIHLLVRFELPDISGINVGNVGTFDVDANTRFHIFRKRLAFSQLLFNRSSLLPGQRIVIGGQLSQQPLTARRVTLLPQALTGDWVVGSTQISSGNLGSFQLNCTGLAGCLIDGPVTVLTDGFTRFRGLSGLQDLTGTTPIRLRVFGLLLKHPNDGSYVMVARWVAKLS